MAKDDTRNSPAFKALASEIEDLQLEQGPLGFQLREAETPNYPWPEHDNPMVAYLQARTLELAETEGWKLALGWLVAHAWFEGAIDALTNPRRK